ncbi:ATP-binding cassette domain-containing protein [Bacillus sp. RG28]|uniref:ATP-binding cassette domain-containing protein n=1 Tax=Gottfriedia endophytica TaxID=2820819 RepID=A0A940NGI0_9BACI|nr:ATP-binding cassette domain-containing protein [Gottfriedia endophytica]MBP0724989.1 ATP-binding cassette domain-containing protein [Gottfriedia endophytica]
MSESSAIIEVSNLKKRYGNFYAVNGISFEVNRGEVFGLLGPNGAGKSTTMEMLVGLRKPDEGTATIAGYSLQKQNNQIKEQIGIQLQSTSLFELLTVKEIIELYASFYKKHIPIEPLIDDMILTEKKNSLVKSLSGGQKQRLAIALAIVHDPQIIFLDEPTTGLDPQARRTLWDIVLKLKEQGKTIVLSTHYMDEAHVLADRIGIMDQGKLIALDTPNNLVNNIQVESAIEFKTRIPQKSELFVPLQSVTNVVINHDFVTLYTNNLQDSLIALLELSKDQHIEFSDLNTRTSTLEDVFLHMTGRGLREE